jgi:endonuclease/exonuclease/phosphatase family metal-dependent hydrolase
VPLTSTSNDHPPALRVASFNIRADTLASRVLDLSNVWHNRKPRVLNVLRELDCDVVGLQECVDHQWRWLQPRLAAQYDSYSVGSDGRRRGELCTLLWKRARFELLAYDTFWLNDEFSPYGRMPHAHRPRICSWVRLGDMRTGEAISVFNTHFDHRAGESGDLVRKRSAELVLRRMEDHGLEHSVLMGDLNSPVDCAACVTLRHDLVDAHDAVHGREGPRLGTYHRWNGKPLEVMDYIFCTPDAQVERFAVVTAHGGLGEHWPSDHFPVIAQLRF